MTVDVSRLSLRGRVAYHAMNLLKAAKEQIADHSRWVQGTYSDFRVDRTVACAIGSFGLANPQISNLSRGPKARDDEIPALRALADAIQSSGWDRGHSPAFRREESFDRWAIDIHFFNDHEDTSHADVMAAFDLAIESQCKVVEEEAKLVADQGEIPV